MTTDTGDAKFIKDTLEQSLNVMPDLIATEQLAILDIQSDIEVIEDEIRGLKEYAMDKVLSEKENGKPKYSNEESRKLAVSRLLVPDGNYNDRLNALKQTKRKLRLAEIEEEKLRNTFKAYQSIAMLRGKT